MGEGVEEEGGRAEVTENAHGKSINAEPAIRWKREESSVSILSIYSLSWNRPFLSRWAYTTSKYMCESARVQYDIFFSFRTPFLPLPCVSLCVRSVSNKLLKLSEMIQYIDTHERTRESYEFSAENILRVYTCVSVLIRADSALGMEWWYPII